MTDKLEWSFAHSEGKCDVVYVEEQYVPSPPTFHVECTT